jgi:ATP-dependent Clp protease ATP-binding subunit ClpC
LDDIVVFQTLQKPMLAKIIDLEVAKVVERIKAKDIHVKLDQKAHEFLMDKGYDTTYGARPMRRAVERFLENPMAEEILKGTIKEGDHIKVTKQKKKNTPPDHKESEKEEHLTFILKSGVKIKKFA